MSALHRFLVEFDLDGPAMPRGAWPLLGRDPLPVEDELELPAFEPAADPVAEAVSAALVQAEAAHGIALQALVERHAADLVEARARWAADEAAPLAAGFRAAVAALEAALAEGAGAALEPLLGEALRVAATDGLRLAIADLVMAGTGGRIAVSGPGDLLEGLRDALAAAGFDPATLDFTPSEAAEVSVTADSSAIETRLGAWTCDLRHRLGHRA